jgi:tetratricopeptide (TPR) repeat protein
MKRLFMVLCIVVFCSTVYAQQAVVTGLLGLDEALNAAASAVEAKVARGTEIAVYKIKASVDEIGEYLCDDLSGIFSNSGRLVPLARETALRAVDAEQDYQMSDLVDDESAVGAGHYIGAKVVITGTFDRYADFSQLRIRAIDVRSSALVAAYTGRISNKDAVLGNIVSPYNTAPLPQVSEDVLAYLNRGKDFYAGGDYNAALREFDRAIALDKNIYEAYYYRGVTYHYKGNFDKAIADFSQTIRLNPNYKEAYIVRGVEYVNMGDNDRGIADFTQAIRLDNNYALAYYNRGNSYYYKIDFDKAIADYTQAIRINPNYAEAFHNRGSAYDGKEDFEKAITDYTQAIRLNPNFAASYNNRGDAYYVKGDYDQAIADFTQALRLAPDFLFAYKNRGNAYFDKGDLNRAITDYEAALKIDPNYTVAKNNLEKARQARGW